MRVLVLVHDLSNNALGRAYCIYLLGQQLGWETLIAGPSFGGGVWEPLSGTEFGRSCIRLTRPVDRNAQLRQLIPTLDLIVAIKTWSTSLGAALKLRNEFGVPVLLDVDDADYEAQLGPYSTFTQKITYATKMLRRGQTPWGMQFLRNRVHELTRTVSNPALQDLYGGLIVPHVRIPRSAGEPHGPRQTLDVAFVGTVRSHKGLTVLRRAVSTLQPNYRLTVTADPPGRVPPWESWVGTTSFDGGWNVLDRSDIVVVPSRSSGYGLAQLPVKLIDAMMAGRAIVASDLPPIRWALNGAGVLLDADSFEDLRAGLQEVGDSGVRVKLGRAARSIALERFVPATVAPVFAEAARRARERESLGPLPNA